MKKQQHHAFLKFPRLTDFIEVCVLFLRRCHVWGDLVTGWDCHDWIPLSKLETFSRRLSKKNPKNKLPFFLMKDLILFINSTKSIGPAVWIPPKGILEDFGAWKADGLKTAAPYQIKKKTRLNLLVLNTKLLRSRALSCQNANVDTFETSVA